MQPTVPLTSQGSGRPSNIQMQLPKNLYRFGEISLYSTYGFVSSGGAVNIANSSNRVFTTQLGGTGQGFTGALTVTETNLKEAARVPTGQAYDIYGVAAQPMRLTLSGSSELLTTPITDAALATSGLASVVNNGVLAWDYTQSKVYICPLMLAGAGGGIFGAVADSTGNTVGSLNNGNGGIWAYRANPVALPSSTTFGVLIEFGSRAGSIGAANVGLAIRIVLLGFYKSAIEVG